MNNITKKIMSFALAVSMLSGTAAMAATFTDMPTDWTAPAVERAIENGLLSGYNDNTVKPENKIRRAEMATIVARCFKATEKADISKFGDVKEGQWFYDAFAKAVEMGAFGGDNLGNLNPENNITFQETFKVIASIFGVIATSSDLKEQDLTVLEQFNDSADVATWAQPYVAAIVANGYWDGIDGNLYPKQHITRAQFAVLMDNIVKTYIDEPGEYSELSDGNVLVRTDGVTINADEFTSSIIISESVLGEEETNINVGNLTGLFVVRGGGEKVTFTGHVDKLQVMRKGIRLHLRDTDLANVKGHNASDLPIDLGTIGQ